MTGTRIRPHEDFDHNAPRSGAELRRLHDELREACPVVHSGRHGGFAMLTRYDDVRHVLHSPEAFSSADGVFIPPSGGVRVPAMEFDEPEHSMWRRRSPARRRKSPLAASWSPRPRCR
jgi:cytochrome P450